MAEIVGGPGWVIRATDLKPVIVDAEAFAEGLRDDPLATPITLLWTGEAAAALGLLEGEPATPRVRALRADCHRDLGDVARALEEYDLLIGETLGTPLEAVMRQHRGKAYFAAGDWRRAGEDFERAVALRRDGDPVLLASAQQALEAAEARLA